MKRENISEESALYLEWKITREKIKSLMSVTSEPLQKKMSGVLDSFDNILWEATRLYPMESNPPIV